MAVQHRFRDAGRADRAGPPGSRSKTFLRERIFEPLGMVDTGFDVPPGQARPAADAVHPTIRAPVTSWFSTPPDGQWSRPPAFPSGAAGLVSTADDFLAFGQMLLDLGRHGQQRILSRPSVRTMITDQLTADQRAGSEQYLGNRGWGFGMSVVTRRDGVAETPGQFGWDGGLGTGWTSDPAEEMVVDAADPDRLDLAAPAERAAGPADLGHTRRSTTDPSAAPACTRSDDACPALFVCVYS